MNHRQKTVDQTDYVKHSSSVIDWSPLKSLYSVLTLNTPQLLARPQSRESLKHLPTVTWIHWQSRQLLAGNFSACLQSAARSWHSNNHQASLLGHKILLSVALLNTFDVSHLLISACVFEDMVLVELGAIFFSSYSLSFCFNCRILRKEQKEINQNFKN